MQSYNLTHLKELEAEAIFIIREVAAQFERPVMLFSGGKDSIIMFHLARKAFFPGKIPFPLMHVDTGHNFPETIEFRDKLMEETGETIVVKYVQDSIDRGTAVEEKGPNASRNGLQTVTLLEGLEDGKYDAALGGARRDEEKARAKGASFHTEMILDNGTQKTNDQNYGTSSMAANTWASISEFSQLATGPKWMFGST